MTLAAATIGNRVGKSIDSTIDGFKIGKTYRQYR